MSAIPKLSARGVRAVGCCAIVAMAAGLAAPADAAFELQIDINSLTATYAPTAGGSFSTSASGTILLTHDANSNLAGLKTDGAAQPVNATLASFSGTIDLVGGVVVGGRLSVILSDGSRYLTSIAQGSGSVSSQAGQGFLLDGLTFSGAFTGLVSGTDFGGVDVSGLGTSDLPGSFLTFAFNPDAQGVDTDTDIDIWVVPSPAGVALFGVAGGFVGLRRRRA